MELFKLLGTIAIDNSGANDAIDGTTEKAEGAHSKMSGAFKKIGSAAVAVGKVVGAGIAAAGTAIGAVAKQALDGYAEYEQLVGGVDTLFKESSKKVQAYANQAYKTAGMSANAYMETVTSFSASLLQSLDGDTAKAADKANQAIIDMSDNANKMGTDIAMIQNAYQGFSKQNYTMLDNLKLGYGGTKGEMERLLEDAMALTGIEYDIDSYADVVDAIHVIQTEMGITGTTAKEASSTISGSISSMKSAWTNLITGLGNEKADLSGLIDNFIVSAETVMDNVVPRIEKILNGITKALPKVLDKITKKLPSLLNSMLPGLIKAATSLLKGLVTALPTILKVLIEQVPYVVTQISMALIEAFPILLDTLKDLVGQVWDYLSLEVFKTGVSFEDALGTVGEIWATYGQPIVDAISGAIKWLGSTWSSMSGALSEKFSEVWDRCTETWSKKGAALFDTIGDIFAWFRENWDSITATMGQVFEGLWDSCVATWEAVGQPLNDMMVDAIIWLGDNWGNIMTTLGDLFAGLWDVCTTVWNSIGQPIWDMIEIAIEWALGLFKKHMPAIQEFFGNAVKGIKDTWDNHLKPVFDAIGKFLKDVVVPAFEWALETIIEPLVEGVFKTIGNLWNNTLKPVFDGICDFITGVFTLDFQKAFNGILGIVTGVIDGIGSILGGLIDTVKNIFTKVVDSIKGAFNFKIELPKIKLPHFSVTPKGWQLGDLLKGVLPKLGIEWYAKGGVLTEPTIFGMNGNNAMVGGEAGAEAVAPIDVLQKYVEESVAKNNAVFADAINDGFDRLLDFLQAYIPELSNMQMVMDSGAVVAELAPAMDARLGKLYIRNERGAR
jgi:phage-related protein